MKLQLLSIVSVLGFVAGCTGGVVGDAAGAGEATADVRLVSPLAKKRDHRPAKTPLERLQSAQTAAHNNGAIAQPAPLPLAATSAVQANLTYNNGPLLESPQIYAVFWGTSVNPNVVSGVPGFFGGITAAASPINSMLAQYNTNGMTIGTGTYSGSIADDDAPMPASGVITDEMIEAEGARLVDTGKVPAENGHNILMFFFPPGVAIDQGGGTRSCEVFCAYHSTFTRNGNNFYYGVIPDQNSGGCENGCGLTKDPVKTTFSTSSHELIEAITDAAVGLQNIAWYDQTFGEIGDVCIEWDGMSNNYYVQSEWSNADKGCVDHSATTHAAIDVAFDDTVVTAAGGSATFNITSSGNASGSIALSTANLPIGANGFTSATFSPASISVGGSSTLTVGIPAGMPSLSYSFKVAGTDSNGAHHFAQVNLHVKGASPTLTSATPATGPSQGGNVVNLVGTNIASGAIAKICSTSTTTCATVTSAGNGVTANGGYVSGSGGTKFQLVMPSHTVAASGSTTVSIWLLNPNDPTPAKVSYKFTTGAAPTVTAVNPPTGPIAGGTFITITGTNFSSNAVVKLGGATLDCARDQNQNCSIVDDKTIVAITPAVAAAGKQAIEVDNIDGLKGTMNGFDYGPNAPPSVDSLSVDTGPTAGGTYVTIFGNNLDANATVTFGGTAAMVKTVNPRFLGVMSPAHAMGAVDVVVANGDAQTAKTTFTYADGTGGGTDDMGTGGGGSGGAGGGGDGTGGGGTGGGGGDGTGGSGGSGGSGFGANHIDNQSGCSMGPTGSAPSLISLLVVLAAFGFALRRQRS